MPDWQVRLKPFLRALDEMPNERRKGRSVYDGYVRGCGLKYGNIRDLCNDDDVFSGAMTLATSEAPNGKSRTIVSPINLMNIFTIIKLNLSHLRDVGHIIEFGSLRGGSAIFLAHVAKHLLPGTQIISFDTFAGFPATKPEIDAYAAGSFEAVDLSELRCFAARHELNNLTFIEGNFEDTVPQALKEIKKVCLAHIDCDLYDSVTFAYEQTKPYLSEGSYIVFDDPLVPTCIGAFEAIEELLIRRDGLHAEQIFPHLVFRAPIKDLTYAT